MIVQVSFQNISSTSMEIVWQTSGPIPGLSLYVFGPGDPVGQEIMFEEGMSMAKAEHLLPDVRYTFSFFDENNNIIRQERQRTLPCARVRNVVLTPVLTESGMLIHYELTWEPGDPRNNNFMVRVQDLNGSTILQRVVTQRTNLQLSPTELEMGQRYEITVQSNCDKNIDVLSEPFILGYDTNYCAQMRDLAVRPSECGELRLTWGMDRRIESYEIHYQIRGESDTRHLFQYDEANGIDKIPAEVTEIVIPNLEMDQEYEIIVYSYCKIGTVSTALSGFGTVTNVCGNLISVGVSDIRQCTTNVAWIRCEDFYFDEYRIEYIETSCYNENQEDLNNWISAAVLPNTLFFYNLTNLDDDTEYFVRVQGICNGIIAATSPKKKFRTAACLEVDEVRVINEQVTEITIRWGPDRGPDVNYVIEARMLSNMDTYLTNMQPYLGFLINNLDGSSITNSIAGNSGWMEMGRVRGMNEFTIHNLLSETNYEFRVMTECCRNKYSNVSPTAQCSPDACSPCDPIEFEDMEIIAPNSVSAGPPVVVPAQIVERCFDSNTDYIDTVVAAGTGVTIIRYRIY